MIPSQLQPWANHLWQSTLFAAVAGLLTLALRNNRAQARYWLWLAASVKFLIPFSILVTAGIHFGRHAPAAIAPSGLSSFVEQVTQPFAVAVPLAVMPAARTSSASLVPVILGAAWAIGFVTLVCSWWRRWRGIRKALRTASPVHLPIHLEAMTSPAFPEPGVFGIRRPVLLLPDGIANHLIPPQFEAILAHELCHVRRRDNLATVIHMVVEAVFWFHPLVWWLGARLMEERERACDEDVLRLGCEPEVYAQRILKICELYLESPLPCVAGVTGANLKQRIEAIMTNHIALKLNFAKKAALTVAGIAALAAPVAVGVLDAPAIHAQSPQVAVPVVAQQIPAQSAATAAPQPAPDYLMGLGVVTPTTVNVMPRVDGQLLSVGFKEGDLVQKGQLLASIDPEPYQAQLAQAEAQLVRDRAQLAAADPVRVAIVAQFATDEANIEDARRRLAYTQIAASMSGMAGLRLVDPGNMVHAEATSIVIINQLQPIAVVFTLPEDVLPQVLARGNQGASLPVEVWNRDNTAKIAAGRLTAVDNQIDPATGAAKLKAVFDNQDGALFPNQFVIARLRLKE